MNIARAAPITPGSEIHVIAPSGPISPQPFARGVAQLRHRGFSLQIPPQVHASQGFFAGDDAARSQTLDQALRHPAPRTIWAARGGYGLTRILHRLPPASACPVWPRIVGFSDICALLCAVLARYGLATLHGPVLTQWGSLHPEDQERTLSILSGEIPAPLVAQAGPALLGGRVEGPLLCANLEVLRSLLGTPDFPDLRGWVLALEDVGERPYRLDRSLTQLMQSGALRGVLGVALGTFERCDPPTPEQPSAQEVVIERLSQLQIPVLGGFSFGHRMDRNPALPVGTRVRLDVEQGTLEMLEPLFV